MSHQQLATRRRSPPAVEGFDDQVWPVNVLLLLLASSTAGLIVAQGDFETSDPLRNGYVHLAVVGWLALLLSMTAAFLGRVVQRRIQIAILLSMLVHLGVCWGMREYRLPVVQPDLLAKTEPIAMPPMATLPEYRVRTPAERVTTEKREEFEKPLATDLPDTDLPDVKRLTAPPSKPAPAAKKDESTELASIQPKPIDVTRAEASAPRRADHLPGPERSRQQPARVAPPELVPLSKLPTGDTKSARRPDTSDDVQRQQTELARIERRAADAPLDSPTLQPSVRGPQQPAGPRPQLASTAPLTLARGLRPDLPASIPVRPELIGAPAAGSKPGPGGGSLEAGSVGPQKTTAGAPIGSGQPNFGDNSQPWRPGLPGGASSPGPRRDAPSGQPGTGEGIGLPGSLARSTTGRGIPMASVPASETTLPIASGGLPGSGASRGGSGSSGNGLATSGDGMGLDSAASAPGRGYTPGGGGGLVAGGIPGSAPGEGFGSGAGLGPGVGPGAGVGTGTGFGQGTGPGLGRSTASGTGELPSLGGVASGSPLGRSGNGGGLPSGIGTAMVPIGPMASTGGVPGGRGNGEPASSGSDPGRNGAGGTGSPAGRFEGDDDIGPQPHLVTGVPLGVAGMNGPGGVGGPGDRPSLDAGIPSPRARPQSEVVSSGGGRLILEKAGGTATIDGRVRDTAVEGLKQRDRQGRGAIAEARGGSEGSEKAVELGLDFLARHQSVDGSWSLHDFAAGRAYENPGLAAMQSNTAGTGLALLSFLGAGYTHTDGKYRTVVARGLSYLLAHQKPDGDLFLPIDRRSSQNVWLYSHGIASIALCEAYGMTREARLRQPAQRALDFIVASQSPQEGGWRYIPRSGSDTSVSGWQVMALKSGELAGLSVPSRSYALVTRWLDHAQGAGGNPSRYAYRPNSTQTHQREPSRVMTAEALLMRQYLGWRRDTPDMIEGAQWLRTNPPQYGRPTTSQPSGDRDAYYWYYATQVMFQMQGDYWRDWNDQLQPLVLASQVKQGPLAGSWDPQLPVPDRWGYWGGRIYLTSLHLLMLEVYYRHLPIYQNLAPQR